MSQESAEELSRTAPGPWSYPLVGILPQYGRDPLPFLEGMAAEYGDVVRCKFGTSVAHLVRHPDHVQHVLQRNQRNYTKKTRGYAKLRHLVGDDLFTSDGDQWLKHRRALQGAFRKEKIRQFDSGIVRAAEALATRWDAYAESGEVFDLQDEMTLVSFRAAGEVMFSADLSTRAEGFGQSFNVVSEIILDRVSNMLQFPPWFPSPQNLRFNRCRKLMVDNVQELLAERRQSGESKADLLSLLIDARDDETGQALSDVEIRDHLISLLTAGHETSATALTFFWDSVTRDSDVERALFEEVDRVLQGELPNRDSHELLEYTMRVLLETLRLYPPAWQFGRRAVEADVIGGFEIPANSIVMLSPYLTHRYEAFWPEPKRFDPDRFLPENQAGRPKFAHFPFGGGPRICIGAGMALFELPLLIAVMAQRFRITRVDPAPSVLEPHITLNIQKGLPVTVERR